MPGNDLRYQFARLDVAGKLIVINVAVFILNGLFTFLLKLPADTISQWFALPADLGAFIRQPWSLVTYSFFHSGLGHIFWNMLLLYFAARIFLNLFDRQRFLTVYFLGVIWGGIVYIFCFNVFPAFMGSHTILIGASAGVTAVLIFLCAYIPDQEVRVVFFNVKLWQVGVFVVLVDLVQIPYGGNAGGHLAHLGGAFFGYVYARQLRLGNDLGSGFSKLLSGIGQWFTPKPKKSTMKTVYRKPGPTSDKEAYDKASRQKKIDSILDKIGKSGYESLSKEEKDFLFKAGKED